MNEEKVEYRKSLEELKAYQLELGLAEDPPTEVAVILPGTDGPGRPVGGLLPSYPTEECGTDEITIRKTLFNLNALLGFKPPRSRSK